MIAGDDCFSERRSSLAGDRPYRHEEGLCELGVAGPVNPSSRPAQRSSVLLSRTSWQPAESYLARWSGGVSIYEASRARAIFVAESSRWRCDDLLRATRLPSIRH